MTDKKQPAAKKQVKEKSRSSVVVSNLPVDIPKVYAATFQTLFASGPPLARPKLINTTTGGLLMFETSTKGQAKALWQRLHGKTIFCRKLTARFGPKREVAECQPTPTVADIFLSKELSSPEVEQLLHAVPGLLAVCTTDGRTSGTNFVATFADEGSALHARAVISGRRQRGDIFLFLRLRNLPLQ